MIHLLLVGIAALTCLASHRIATKLPIPSLLIFIFIGILFGVNGIGKIQFENFELTESICSVALLFIMYFGGFNTNIKEAKEVVGQAVIMATAGVCLTAAIAATCIHYILNLSWINSLLISSVIASTDAASVFSILRSQDLSLKYKTDSLLEIESGSNDPMSYMLTCVFTALALGSSICVPVLLAKQILIGLAAGYILSQIAIRVLETTEISMDQGEIIFLLAIGIIGYSLPNLLGGNGYLSVYLAGILIGNSNISHKQTYAKFFNVITSMCQMIIFFILGLLVTPTNLPHVFIPALIVFICLTFIARPLASIILLSYKHPSKEKTACISWSGFRGVASIVFSIYIMLNKVNLPYNIFDLVFVVVLLSLLFQGATLASLSKRLDMIDETSDVRRTFNDFASSQEYVFIELELEDHLSWSNKKISDIEVPKGTLIALVIRDNERIIPNGDVILLPGDKLVLVAPQFNDNLKTPLHEVIITNHSPYKNKTLASLNPNNNLLVLSVKRGDDIFIPTGKTKLEVNDIAILYK